MDSDAAAGTAALAGGFPPADRAAWERLAAAALKGASPDSLVRPTDDGIPVRPLYARGDGEALGRAAGLPGGTPFVRGGRAAGTTAAGWDLRQRHAHPDPARANPLILDDLERGATSISLRVADTGADAPDGLVVVELADLERALAGVHLDLAPVALDAGGRSAEAAALLLALLERRGHAGDAGAVRAELGLDPLGAALRGAPLDPDAGLALAAGLAARAAGRWPGVVPLRADGRPWHGAGASEAQELAAACATALAHLRALDAAGLPPDHSAGLVGFTLAADADFFLTAAKLRALRRLWARVLEVAGAPEAAGATRLHAETAARMYARRDPWVNLLRGTVACFAAAAGGAEGVTVLPLDHALGLPGPLARRLARNTQLVLMEESNLHRVADPAGGAWYVESLTEELAAKAWGLFRRIEAEGGMAAACRAGTPQGWVAATRAERERRIATRREAVTGVSEFPDLAERPVEPERFDAAVLAARARERLATAVPAAGPEELLARAREGRPVVAVSTGAGGIAPLPSRRLGEAFEALRDRGDAALARDGRRPRVLLANLGPPAEHTARATFARNLLEAGGIEPVASEPLASGEAAAAALAGAGARIAALCSSDEVYADLAAPAARALRAAGCELVCLMGRPGGERRAGLEEAGVGLFIHAGADMIEILAGLHDRLGTPPAGERAR